MTGADTGSMRLSRIGAGGYGEPAPIFAFLTLPRAPYSPYQMFVQNTAPDNQTQSVILFMFNSDCIYWRIFLFLLNFRLFTFFDIFS